MSWYTEALRDPRWQRKRLEVMQRDDWKCCRCSRDTVTLNVHHREYIRGRMPWEYSGEVLETLCEDCHKREHSQQDHRIITAIDPPHCYRTYNITSDEADNFSDRLCGGGPWTARDCGEYWLVARLLADPRDFWAISNSYLDWLSWESEEIVHAVRDTTKLSDVQANSGLTLHLSREASALALKCAEHLQGWAVGSSSLRAALQSRPLQDFIDQHFATCDVRKESYV